MNEYSLRQIFPGDRQGFAQVDALLAAQGIRRDTHLDYTCGIFDGARDLIATGSCYGNTFRCFAVAPRCQGEGLLGILVTHLTEVAVSRGNSHVFLYTKAQYARLFSDLGFSEIIRVGERLVFMENKPDGFRQYLSSLQASGKCVPGASALVMNANPFTKGHLYLTEKAARESELVHLFLVSEDKSLIPFEVRKRLVLEGTRHLKNLRYHECGSYMISQATFPGYFAADRAQSATNQALTDVSVFLAIAAALGIAVRYIGEEPSSAVTRIYNQTMLAELPKHGLRCVLTPRLAIGGQPVSASTVRRYLQLGDLDKVAALVPRTTLTYLQSPEAAPVLERIRRSACVVHH